MASSRNSFLGSSNVSSTIHTSASDTTDNVLENSLETGITSTTEQGQADQSAAREVLEMDQRSVGEYHQQPDTEENRDYNLSDRAEEATEDREDNLSNRAEDPSDGEFDLAAIGNEFLEIVSTNEAEAVFLDDDCHDYEHQHYLHYIVSRTSYSSTSTEVSSTTSTSSEHGHNSDRTPFLIPEEMSQKEYNRRHLAKFLLEMTATSSLGKELPSVDVLSKSKELVNDKQKHAQVESSCRGAAGVDVEVFSWSRPTAQHPGDANSGETSPLEHENQRHEVITGEGNKQDEKTPQDGGNRQRKGKLCKPAVREVVAEDEVEIRGNLGD